MDSWPAAIPWIDWALITAVAIVGLSAMVLQRRGGRFRALPGWFRFWLQFGPLLILLSWAHRWISFALLAVLMLVALRTYFSVAPLRPRDGRAILAAYLAVPFALLPGFVGSTETFLATVPIVLVLLFPALLSVGRYEPGLLDSLGRVLLGVLLFDFCAAHLGLLSRREGLLELFGLLVLAAELPQRAIGRRRNDRWVASAIGPACGVLLATVTGFIAGPWGGMVEEDSARAGFLVAIAVTLGGWIVDAVLRDLGLGSAEVRVGRAAVLDRAIPAVVAAPVFFHYWNHFA